VIKDADTLDLYEYACALVPINYPDTIGELRMRLVKATPKDLWACQRCLDATLTSFDWIHAQQVSVYSGIMAAVLQAWRLLMPSS